MRAAAPILGAPSVPPARASDAALVLPPSGPPPRAAAPIVLPSTMPPPRVGPPVLFPPTMPRGRSPTVLLLGRAKAHHPKGLKWRIVPPPPPAPPFHGLFLIAHSDAEFPARLWDAVVASRPQLSFAFRPPSLWRHVGVFESPRAEVRRGRAGGVTTREECLDDVPIPGAPAGGVGPSGLTCRGHRGSSRLCRNHRRHSLSGPSRIGRGRHGRTRNGCATRTPRRHLCKSVVANTIYVENLCRDAIKRASWENATLKAVLEMLMCSMLICSERGDRRQLPLEEPRQTRVPYVEIGAMNREDNILVTPENNCR